MNYSKFIILILTLTLFPQCRKDKPLYIFLITLDTTRADAINYDPGNNRTPNLASLSSEGTTFRNAYTNIPITLPSHASMFYSLYPHDLKIYNNGQTNKTKYPSLVQLLKSRGFRTGAAISLGVLNTDFGLSRGFDSYIENFSQYSWTKSAEQVNRDLFPVISSIKEKRAFIWAHYSDPHEPYYPPYYDGIFEIFSGNQKVFTINNSLYFNFKKKILLKPGKNRIVFKSTIPSQVRNNPDCSISGIFYQGLELSPSYPDMTEIIYPEDFRKVGKKKDDYFSDQLESVFIVNNKKQEESEVDLRFTSKLRETEQSRKVLYLESISYMDKHIGELIRFLKKKGIYNNSIILIAGDHGEGLGEYQNHFGHIHYLNKVYTHVPFIITGRGISKGEIRNDLASNLDIAPTILDIAGIKVPEFMKGSKLLSERSKNKLILETFSPEAYFDAFSIIEFPDQIIFYPGKPDKKIEYIHLGSDRYGTNVDQNRTSADDKAKLLRSILGISRSITATKGKVGNKKRIHEDILKSLGYL